MAKKRKFTDRKAVNALIRHHGIVAAAADDLGVARETLSRHITGSTKLQAARNQAREVLKDFAESKLFRNIEAAHPASIFFYLKTQAKDRGYIERNELTGAGGGPIEVTDVAEDFDAKVIAAIEYHASAKDAGKPDGR